MARNVTSDGLYGVQLELNYDPSLISTSNLRVNPNLSFVVFNSADNTAGKIRLVASQQGNVSGLIGDVTLLTFDATVAETSGTVTFHFENEKFSDSQAQSLEFISQGYTVSIGSDVQPEPTDTPVPQPTDPTDDSSGIPLCSDHDPNTWHPLYDAERNCHYDHEHKHDPNELNDIFGPPGAWFDGNEMSYPWQTFAGANGNYPDWDGNPDNLENVAKHKVYGWITRRDIPSHDRSVWIKDFRLQYHAMSGPPGTLTRHHSFSLEVQMCKSNGQCGIVRTGGWLDFGNLEVSGHGVVPLPGQEDATGDDGRRRIHYHYNETPNRADSRFKAEFFWYGRNAPPEPPFGPLSPVLIALATNDAFSNVAPNNPQATNFFCPDFQCNKNGSTIQAHVVQLEVKNDFDPDDDGLADFVGYTDRYGLLNESCEEIGLDCIPLVIEHAPVGRPQHRDDTHLGLTTAGAQDFDTSPPGEWWITYPIADAATPELPPEPPSEPTPEPTQEPTPQPTDEPTISIVFGQVILPGRVGNDWSDATVIIDDNGQNGSTDTNGNFAIADVAYGLYNSVTVDASGYLPAVCSQPVVQSTQTALTTITLLSGDINDDSLVNIVDATAVGAGFGQTGLDLIADINRDFSLDIFDIVLVSVNYGAEGPTTWSCMAN